MVDKEKRNKRQYEWQKANKERINFTMEKGTKESISIACGKLNIKPSEFIRQAIEEKLDRVL